MYRSCPEEPGIARVLRTGEAPMERIAGDPFDILVSDEKFAALCAERAQSTDRTKKSARADARTDFLRSGFRQKEHAVPHSAAAGTAERVRDDSFLIKNVVANDSLSATTWWRRVDSNHRSH